jgi:hypothetical protein
MGGAAAKVAPKPSHHRAKPAIGTANMVMPKTAMEHAFCESWLKCYNQEQARRKAGYKNVAQGHKLYRKFATYLAKRQTEKEKVLTQTAVRGQKEILEELMSMGFANPHDYIEVYEEGGKKKVRQKPITELTRLQAAAISGIRFQKNGTATYRIPNRDEKIPALIAAGRHFGMFHDKLIQEHRHLHMRQSVDLTDVGNALLEEVEAKLLLAVGPQKARQLLGVTIEGEYEDVTEK